MPPCQYTDDQIRTAMAAPGSIIQKAATIGAHHSALAYRARKLGLLAPPTPRPGNGKATARKLGPRGKAKPANGQATTPAAEPKQEAAPPRQFYASRHLEKAAREPNPTPASLPVSLADSGTELSRMAGIVQGFAALSATGRAWVLARIQAS